MVRLIGFSGFVVLCGIEYDVLIVCVLGVFVCVGLLLVIVGMMCVVGLLIYVV